MVHALTLCDDPTLYRGYSAWAYKVLAVTSLRRLLSIHTAEARHHARLWLTDLRNLRALGY